MGKAVNRPYAVSVALSDEEMGWLRELAQIEGMTEERVLRRAMGRYRKRVLKRTGHPQRGSHGAVEVAG